MFIMVKIGGSKKRKLNENTGNLEILMKQGGIYEFCANREEEIAIYITDYISLT